ncbi:MAG: TRAP transporter substrate-binding protein [Candidatus Eremiobacteraeota bacterium]|nr:TRAP transporter substrate-binding protein [Candidatus Eremiobacteraeota bacterium]
MKRKRFVAAGTAFASIGIVRAPAKAAQFQGKCGTDTPIEHPINVRAIQMFNAIKAETGGRLEVKVFPNNSLGGNPAMLQQIRTGALEFMMANGAGTIANVFPLAGMESLGFVFKDDAMAFRAMDGAFGEYVRKQINDKAELNITIFGHEFEHGFRQITTSSKPIHAADDLAGVKLRTPVSKIWTDLFQTLGASPISLNFAEVYVALQTKVADGQENPLVVIEVARLFEVQRYLSLTSHMWAGYNLISNAQYWKALPKDIQDVVERNLAKYSTLQRADTINLNNSLADKLRRQGMQVVNPDRDSFKKKLGPYYARWKNEFGQTAWSLLEQYTGKIG